MAVSLNKTHSIVLRVSKSHFVSIHLNIKLNIDILILAVGLALNNIASLAG